MSCKHFYIFAVSLILLLSGCSSAPVKHEWNTEHSEALNISTFAGIEGLKDSDLPADVSPKDAFRVPGALVYGVSGYMNPVRGFTQWGTAGMNVASFLFASTPEAKLNHFFLWDDSATTKEEYYKNFISAFEKAKKAYLANSGKYKIRSGYRAMEKTAAFVTLHPSWFMNLSGPGCTTAEKEWACSLGFNLGQPPKMAYNPRSKKLSMHTDAPENPRVCIAVDGEEKSRCGFYNRGEANRGFNELGFLLEFSKYLPEGYYFYIAPKRLFLDHKKPVKIPVIVNQGKTLYFLNPASVGHLNN
ncbi:MAG: hypothetical protein K6L73_13180 [Cellvibrionaceae bacterium]